MRVQKPQVPDYFKSEFTLRDIPLFSELSIQQLRSLTSVSKLKHFSKHTILFREGDFYTGFYVLLKGVIKVFKVNPQGKESVVHIVRPFGAFADIPLFEGGNYPVDAEAIEDSLALFVPKEGFLDLISKEPEISLKMLAGFAKRLKALVNQLEDISSKEVPNRLAKYLLQRVTASGTENLPEPFIKLIVPKSTIAAYLGTVTETLSRTLRKFQNENIIRVIGKKIFVIDMKRLRQLAE
ncbi:MAG: Crp/Fnr family transcriptional regulator [bacterium]|nr:Crp/Fnr family transcriptional regulator [bacterium]